MKYTIDQQILHYEASGNRAYGDDTILLHKAIDLTAGTSWHKTGFTIQPLFEPDRYKTFIVNTRKTLLDLWREAGLTFDTLTSLDQYHVVAAKWKTHLNVLEKTKLLPTHHFPVAIKHIENRISEICQQPVVAKNPFDGQSVFHFRIIRPVSADNNPLHRDVWLEDYKDCINLYIPIAGSNEQSSLILAEGSHLWPESRVERTLQGAVINEIKFNVPAVTAINGSYSLVRPNPSENEVLIFSPYLIHGGAANLNTDRTRISIEIRLWKK